MNKKLFLASDCNNLSFHYATLFILYLLLIAMNLKLLLKTADNVSIKLHHRQSYAEMIKYSVQISQVKC